MIIASIKDTNDDILIKVAAIVNKANTAIKTRFITHHWTYLNYIDLTKITIKSDKGFTNSLQSVLTTAEVSMRNNHLKENLKKIAKDDKCISLFES